MSRTSASVHVEAEQLFVVASRANDRVLICLSDSTYLSFDDTAALDGLSAAIEDAKSKLTLAKLAAEL